ncbi:ABC transporter ATP-binding protein [Maricaulaceae bacterium MS644]
MSALSINNLHITLSGRVVVSGVSLTVEPGEHVALVGPNGAGKSSLLKAVLGLVPAAGSVRLSGEALRDLSSARRARLSAYLPQERQAAWSITGADLAALGRFAFGGRAYDRLSVADRDAVDRALARADAAHLKDRPIDTLSGGEQSRLHLARALAAQAPLLLADEPGAALDPRHQLDAMMVLKGEADRGAAVMAALHDLALAERFADRIVVMDEGRIVTDAPAGEALTEDVLRGVFRVARRPAGGFDPV